MTLLYILMGVVVKSAQTILLQVMDVVVAIEVVPPMSRLKDVLAHSSYLRWFLYSLLIANVLLAYPNQLWISPKEIGHNHL